MALALRVCLLLSFACLVNICAAQSQAPVRTVDLAGDMMYVVTNRDNGDIYLAAATPFSEVGSTIYRLDENLSTRQTADVPEFVKFMIIDYVRTSLIVCGSNSRCFRYELENLRRIDVQATCVFSDYYPLACTPTGSDVVAFFAGANYDVLFAATTPQLSYQDCEIPRIASRSTADANFLGLLSGSETSDKQSALFLSTFSNSFPGPESVVYGFSHNGFSYFVGSLGLANSGTEARIFRVCQSDTTYSSYMEVPLQCRQPLQWARSRQPPSRRKRVAGGDEMIYRQSVTWAQLTTASQGLASLEYREGEDVLYYVMSRGLLCATSMSQVEDAFLLNIDMCLDGLRMNPAAPDETNNATWVECPGNTQYAAEDVVCDIPGDLRKFSGPVPIVGQAVMDVDVGETVMASVVNTGKLSVFLSSDGSGYMRSVPIWPAHTMYSPYPDEPLFECAPVNTQFRLHPDNAHVYTFANNLETLAVTVTKSRLANCSLHGYSCDSCVREVYCGWCTEQNRCTLESECSNGAWLQTDAESFYNELPNEACLYIDQVGSHTVTFSPQTGLHVGTTLLVVNITVEKEIQPSETTQIYIGDDLLCYGAHFSYTSPGGLVGDTRLPSNYTLRCNVDSPEFAYEGPVSVKLNYYPAILWLNSTEHFRFVEPTFRDFAPLKGPQAGGTLLELNGTNLLSGDSRHISIGGLPCELKIDFSTDERLVCVTEEAPQITLAPIQIDFSNQFTLTSLRSYSYTENPFIEMIYPLKTFVGGGELQYVVGTNLDSIARPLFVVQMFVNESLVDEFNSVCRVRNSTFMACPSPEIAISEFLNGTRSKRSADDAGDDECNEVTTTPSGEPIEFRIGLVLDGVEEWLPSVIDQHLDSKYTTIIVTRDPVYYMFSGSRNILSFNPSVSNYLVIEGERLDCGASVQDITVEIGLAFCTPVVSLYRTQLTCTPPEDEPPVRSEYAEDHGLPHVLVRVGLGSSRYMIGYIDYAEAGSALEAWVIAIAVCVIILVLLAIAAVVFFVVRRMRRADDVGGKREKSRENEYQSTHPTTPAVYQTITLEDGSTYLHLVERGKMPLMEQLDEGTRLQIQDVMIESKRLQLSSNEILGKGQFGRVLLGDLSDKSGKGSTKVAVKSLKKNTDIEDVVKFLQEGLMMKDFKHENVLGLVGVCIDEDDCPMIVMPYMKHGDLKSFVENPERALTVGKLVTYSLHVAQGMEYLATLKFVHRDLAARNCMVDESETIKVSDFGLSRDIYEREYYASEDKKAKLPIRWMPLESIKNSVFTVKTDVWSYGILVWELLTRGELPYASVDNWDIPGYLERGRRLSQPSFAPDDLYEILLQCWHENPEKRPEFGTVCKNLREILERGEKAPSGSDSYYLQPVESPLYITAIA